MINIGEAHILIMATDGFEESELFGPREILLAKGAWVTLASPTRNPIQALFRAPRASSVVRLERSPDARTASA